MPALVANVVDELSFPGGQEGIAENDVDAGAIMAAASLVGDVFSGLFLFRDIHDIKTIGKATSMSIEKRHLFCDIVLAQRIFEVVFYAESDIAISWRFEFAPPGVPDRLRKSTGAAVTAPESLSQTAVYTTTTGGRGGEDAKATELRELFFITKNLGGCGISEDWPDLLLSVPSEMLAYCRLPAGSQRRVTKLPTPLAAGGCGDV